ncbi:Pyridoxamine 5'-phosphate oxidase [Labilithrix luteola]|uniref:Pyridoxamine 5'-phosphate oxidase n=1 Tax=Labilithrix luteola TaxID=1391654 RepID=A0A0K1PUP0_9BACT|nr:pyridoxamine 5'-phosphate oxidase [Labilithrix luteola]AKU97096.1 Pyridoxamine 5'-phosphate oxidase [Labilithrix luteola]
MTVAMYVDLTEIRTEYARAGLQERALNPSPIRQLERWLREAIDAKHPEPTAMTVATVDAEGQPSSRIVLLKTLDDRGLVFFTNYDSDKGHDLAQNPRACASFFWVMLERQVRVTGSVSMVPRDESEAYFRSRPRESQIGAWASRQSAVLSGREELDRIVEETRARFGEGEIPCPPNWGGYLLTPSRVEFWQGRPSRLHDRLRYTRDAQSTDAWVIERLSP